MAVTPPTGGARGRATGRGLLLAGGAVRGAFQAGVVCALARAGIEFDAVAGVSIGAVNGAALLLGYGPRLCEMWRENLRAVRWFDPGRILRGRSPFLISEAMRIMVARYGDVGRIRAHPTELLISATDWHTGRNVLFSTRDEGYSDEERVLQFLASLTIPYLCTEAIVIRGRRYCDGALSSNFPLEALLARGCRDVLIVDPSPGRTEAALGRLLAPVARRLAAIPLAPARIAAGFVRAVVGRPPRALDGGRLRVVVPPGGLTFRSLDFTSLAAIDRALDAGVEAGERVAREMRREPPGVRP
jgi:predicted acylesterase/phospholipase RssA